MVLGLYPLLAVFSFFCSFLSMMKVLPGWTAVRHMDFPYLLGLGAIMSIIVSLKY